MADDRNRINISEPDENGIRYYDMSAGNQPCGVQDNTQKKQKKKNKTSRNILIFAVILLAVALIGVSTSGYMMMNEASGPVGYTDNPYIATLYVEGTIQDSNTDYFGNAVGYQHKWTLDTIDGLMDDPNNVGIILWVETPGGGVYESDELYLKIREYQDVTGNPVYSVMGQQATSGGYYISAPCDKIYANRNTWTGSIGVTIGTILDFSELFEKFGIKAKTITSGDNKAMGSNYQEMTPEEEAIWQSLVDEAYQQFAGIVAEGRGLSLDYVYSIADGRIMSASQAIDAALVDEIGGIEEAYADMEQIIEQNEGEYMDIDLIDVKYSYNNSILTSLITGVVNTLSAVSGSDEASSVIELAEKVNTTPVSYMCDILAD